MLLPVLASTLPSAAEGDAIYSAADLAHAVRLRDAALGTAHAYALASSLVQTVGPRAAGSDADGRAVAWAVGQLGRLGFANVRAEPVPLRVWQRGATAAQLVAPRIHELVVTALGNTVGTAPEGLEAEVAYYPDFDSLRNDTSTRARGRIVFIDQKMARTRDGSGYGTAVPSRFAGAVQAGRRGAVAVAIRSIGTDNDPIAHTGSMRYDPGVAEIPTVAVSVPDADLIAQLQAAGTPLRMKLRLERTAPMSATSHNVIAEVPGTDLAGEIVLLCAHLDSWDITPGAQDNAAGVGIVTAAAKALLDGGVKPRRTVRIALFANEENGFDGASSYAAKYRDVPHQLVGESDAGAGRSWRMCSLVRTDALSAIAAMAQLLQPLAITPDGNRGSPGPDAGVLVRARRWPAMELTQDLTGYFDVHHTVNDTLDHIEPAAMQQNAAAWAVVAWLAAQSRVAFGPMDRT